MTVSWCTSGCETGAWGSCRARRRIAASWSRRGSPGRPARHGSRASATRSVWPTDRGCARSPFPTSSARDPAPPLPEGAVTTTYEQMTTFGVEYGPYTRLAAAFRRPDPGRPAHRTGAGHLRRRRGPDGGARRHPPLGGPRRRVDRRWRPPTEPGRRPPPPGPFAFVVVFGSTNAGARRGTVTPVAVTRLARVEEDR